MSYDPAYLSLAGNGGPQKIDDGARVVDKRIEPVDQRPTDDDEPQVSNLGRKTNV